MAMEDDLVVEWDKLKLTEEEEDTVEFKEEILEDRREEIKLSLIGKFLMTNTFSMRAMKSVMQTILQPSKGIVVRELGRNLFLFQFFLRKDKDFALSEGPWSFDGHLLLLKE